MSNRTRVRLVAALLLLLVAASGFAVGLFTERVFLDPPVMAAPAPPAAPEGVRILLRGQDTLAGDGVRRFGVLLPERMAEALDLTPEQTAEIERILREDQAAIRELTEQFEPALVALIERSRQRIHDVLTEEQIERWHASPMLRLRRGVQQPTMNPEPR
jgi:hypothetical protein